MNENQSHISRVIIFVRNYPIPIIALVGLVLGGVFYLPYGEQAQRLTWFVTLLVGGAPIVWQTIRGMMSRHFASDIVAMLAIIVSIALNDAFPGVIIVLMQSGGKALEDYAYRRASSSLDTLLSRAPKRAHRKKDGVLEEVDVSEINVGDILVVKPGDLVPVDGEIIKSHAQVDESSLTGEPLPKTKNAGEPVFSGTINAGKVFEIRAKRISTESQYSRIVQLVRKAQQEKAPIQRLADKYAVWFTPITIVIGSIGWIMTHSFETVLSVLVVATPCSLIFATPVAIISGINKAAKIGVIVKTGTAIEEVGKAKVVVFDKTGTITFGTPSVDRIISFDKFTSDQILFKAASLEQLSSHPIASMIVQKGEEKFGKLPFPTNFREIIGAGVEGVVEDEHILVGAPSIFSNLNDEIFKQSISINEQIEPEGRMIAFVGVNSKLSGAIIFGDKIRPEVGDMMRNLQKNGILQTILLTGDTSSNARTIAKQVNITNFEAELTPEEKVVQIKKLRQMYETVVMVGDGINDAPALAASTVGIAMGARGTAISAEAADVVLLVDNVSKVVNLIEIGKRTISVAKQSIFVGLGFSFLLIGIATFGYLPPATGALLQEVLDVAVIINALRAR